MVLCITLVCLSLTCVYAVPVPTDLNFTFAKDTSAGFGLAGFGGKANGVVDPNKSIGVSIPDHRDDRVQFTALDNVDTGVAFAVSSSLSTAIKENNIFTSSLS